MAGLLWTMLAVPGVAGAVLSCAGRRGERIAFPVGLAVAAVTLGLALAVAVVRPSAEVPLLLGIAAGVSVDGLSALLVVTVAVVVPAVLWFCRGAVGPRESPARFTGLMLLFSGSMLGTVTASGLAPLLISWEVMGATSWALIGFRWCDSRRVRAAGTAFVTTRAADLGMYLAAGAAVAGGAGSLAFRELPGLGQPWITLVTAGMVTAALGKSAQLPFHFWLSRAMEGPSGVSALLHSATMVAAGGYLLLRLRPLLAETSWAEEVVTWSGALTALVLGLVAVAQRDLKQLLAASTAAQLGFVVLASGIGSVVGGATHLVAHAATKSALFLAAGAWLTALGTKRLSALRGAAREYPSVGVAFTVAAAALAGVPPLSLWATENEISAAALEHGPALYAVVTVASLLATGYAVRAVRVVWSPARPDSARERDEEARGTRTAPAAGALPALVLLVGLSAVLGVLALPPAVEQLAGLIGVSAVGTPAAPETVLSGVLAVGVAALAWWWGERPVPVPRALRGLFAEWVRFESLARLLLVRPVTALAGGLASFDERVLDRGVRAVPAAGLWSARTVERGVELPLEALVRLVAGTARRLGALARRVQTGQLHQYYAQAAVVLAVLALLVVLVR
ncbi:NADH-quinone oxidoreductase subunit L [Actinopolyspora saharensis]|uniref:NADH:ubiquinone oxidoreductase subunit 5 (Chain L)/Multisubunit Na+/H+ antiporter, MnhA subunit n=1 Tax=Actinopolyspora saharensis TaxID=995062 RepID=A0A1H0ZFL3_9ACTN|nr:proton-conducting transporter membrane subunit [Actinopolyspora saharensis]SDQ26220.1 NADH:ubiquinone oxidoreductase subunit 5 (chain L)/Multisubunit Na+/H+ antiporter, MnhA subunit [Actinopolyspora saharensis]